MQKMLGRSEEFLASLLDYYSALKCAQTLIQIQKKKEQVMRKVSEKKKKHLVF